MTGEETMRVLLITACGCTRMTDVPADVAGRQLLIPIVRSRWVANVSGKVFPVVNREFEYERTDGDIEIYREVFKQ